MEIVIAAQGLACGPNTISQRSLGGSETASCMMARELRILGHLVTIFCNLPPAGRPDHIPSGFQDDVGLRWVDINQYAQFISNTEVDLLIVSRNPELFQVNHQAKKSVLWCHDLATYLGILPRLMQVSWNFDEIWCVSEFHKEQIHKVCGYPKKNIRATRNGIVRFDNIIPVPREEKTLLYSARPERGLINLVKEGGIMEGLSDYKLRITFYENYPDHLKEFYAHLWQRCEALPNVELLGPKTQMELRQLMASTWMYAYPTEFEEVSCILAREAIEQQLPFLTTKVGALEETLGSCGYYMNRLPNEDEFVNDYIEAIKYLEACPDLVKGLRDFCSKRTDLYWSDVAKQWEEWSEPITPNTYSLLSSLIEDSDIVCAKAVMDRIDPEMKTKGIAHIDNDLQTLYPYLYGTESYESYYDRNFRFEDAKFDGRGTRPNPVTSTNIVQTPRYQSIKAEVALIPDGKIILDFGCAEGVIILNLARDFPNKTFLGVDFQMSNIILCDQYAEELGLTNAKFLVGDISLFDEGVSDFDAAVCSEVLEHVEKPWELIEQIESRVKTGGKIIITVPQGPWEFLGIKEKEQWWWRQHIWHITKWMMRKMFADKDGCQLSNLTTGITMDGRAYGHLMMSYEVDHKPIHPVDPFEKANQHRCRQTMAACMIAMNEEDVILRVLNSIDASIHQLQIAIGPSTDNTIDYIEEWSKDHPWVELRIVDVPKIEAKKFGFDDARNASIEGIEADWILWIDSDEYLSGPNVRAFLRNNCFDSYAIHQHHFTCDPRGTPAQLDKPARLIRNDGRFSFFGKVHEHAELGFNGGPGFVMVLPNVDIGHTGYVNEYVRRERFSRNFPLLEWDQEIYPDRKLGRYLWFRDILHRMKIMASVGNGDEARRLAEEAIDFYRKNDFDGAGHNNAIAFYSEAMAHLGRGFPITVQMQIAEQTANYSGIFESADEAFDMGKKSLDEEIRKRTSGYWM